MTRKYHDYLYGATFEVITDNNPLTYVFTTAKLDATIKRWPTALANYNCTKRNTEADSFFRLHENETTVFPDVLKAISQSIIVQKDKDPKVESLTTDFLDNPILYPEASSQERLQKEQLK